MVPWPNLSVRPSLTAVGAAALEMTKMISPARQVFFMVFLQPALIFPHQTQVWHRPAGTNPLPPQPRRGAPRSPGSPFPVEVGRKTQEDDQQAEQGLDRKSTRLNSSHG